MDQTIERTIDRFPDKKITTVPDRLAVEQQIKLCVNEDEVLTTTCSPGRLTELAAKLGICLCGLVRGEQLNIYSHEERITT